MCHNQQKATDYDLKRKLRTTQIVRYIPYITDQSVCVIGEESGDAVQSSECIFDATGDTFIE